MTRPLIAAVLLAVAVVAGCGGTETTETAAVGQGDGGAESVGALTVGWVIDPSWSQVPVAEELNYFDDLGVDVTVVPFPTGAEALEALTGGAVDVATAGDVPTSAAILKNPDIRVIADDARWPEGRFVARKSAGIESIDDLAGRKIAVPLGSSAHYFAAKFLDEAGVEAELVQVGPAEMVTVISRGDVDAVAVFQTALARVAAELGDDRVELQGEDPYEQHSLYLTQAATIESKGPALTAFVEAIRMADAPLTEGDDDALAALAKATTLEPELLRPVVEEFVFETELGDELAADLLDRAEWAKGIGRIDATAQLPDYHDYIVRDHLRSNG